MNNIDIYIYYLYILCIADFEVFVKFKNKNDNF